MLDSLDGRVARLLRVDSQMGKELDSLADVVTFGAAPAVLMYYTSFSNYGIIGLYIAGLFPLFGAYRLARFNVTPSSTSMKYFTGVPITASGRACCFLNIIFTYHSQNRSYYSLCNVRIFNGESYSYPKFKRCTNSKI